MISDFFGCCRDLDDVAKRRQSTGLFNVVCNRQLAFEIKDPFFILTQNQSMKRGSNSKIISLTLKSVVQGFGNELGIPTSRMRYSFSCRCRCSHNFASVENSVSHSWLLLGSLSACSCKKSLSSIAVHLWRPRGGFFPCCKKRPEVLSAN